LGLSITPGQSEEYSHMKAQIPSTKEVEVSHVRILAAVNYEEEEIPNDFPGRLGETWDAVVNIDTGVIHNWPTGRPAKMHLTVKDSGAYYLLTPDGNVVGSIENNYVPHRLIPGKYGDVIELDIDSTGRITNWPKNPDLCQFFDGEED
jgi:hypothetical protein